MKCAIGNFWCQIQMVTRIYQLRHMLFLTLTYCACAQLPTKAFEYSMVCNLDVQHIYKTHWLIEGWFNKNTGNLHHWIPLMSTVWNIFLGTNNKILVSTNWGVQKMKGRSFCMTDRLVSGKKGVYSLIKSLQHWQCSPSCSWRLICLPTGVIRHSNK